jgi:hypothetical protein
MALQTKVPSNNGDAAARASLGVFSRTTPARPLIAEALAALKG